jgi:hypothetical protein
VHAAFEVAVTGEHRRCDDVAGLHGAPKSPGLQGARVTDASRAAVAGDVEASRQVF